MLRISEGLTCSCISKVSMMADIELRDDDHRCRSHCLGCCKLQVCVRTVVVLRWWRKCERTSMLIYEWRSIRTDLQLQRVSHLPYQYSWFCIQHVEVRRRCCRMLVEPTMRGSAKRSSIPGTKILTVDLFASGEYLSFLETEVRGVVNPQ